MITWTWETQKTNFPQHATMQVLYNTCGGVPPKRCNPAGNPALSAHDVLKPRCGFEQKTHMRILTRRDIQALNKSAAMSMTSKTRVERAIPIPPHDSQHACLSCKRETRTRVGKSALGGGCGGWWGEGKGGERESLQLFSVTWSEDIIRSRLSQSFPSEGAQPT